MVDFIPETIARARRRRKLKPEPTPPKERFKAKRLKPVVKEKPLGEAVTFEPKEVIPIPLKEKIPYGLEPEVLEVKPELTEYAKKILRGIGREDLIEEEIPIPEVPEAELPSILERIYPELFEPKAAYPYPEIQTPEMVAETIETFATEDPEGFLEDLISRGRTPDAEALLMAFGATPEDIEAMFAPPEPFKIPEEGLQFIEEVQEPYITPRGVEAFRPVRKLFTVRPDYSVELEGKTIGTYKPETGVIEPVEVTTIQLAKENLEVAWGKYIIGEFSWGEFGDLALGGLGVLGSYIEKYVGRPWETAVLEARSRTQKAIGLGTEMDDIALRRLEETRVNYGWAGALIAEDVSDIWHDYLNETAGPAYYALGISEWLNPAYLIPVGGIAGWGARFTSKIPLLGKAMQKTAAGVQAIERGITYPVIKPLEFGVRYGARSAEAVGKRIGESLGNRLIKQTDNLLLEIPETGRMLDGVLVNNWQRRALATVAKIPPIKVGIEKALGWRVLLKRESMEIGDIVGRAGVAHAEISRMGTNAKAIKMWELREISTNPIKLFGFNNEGYSATLFRKLLPEYASEKPVAGTLEHIFAKPEMYALTEKQILYVTRFHEAQSQVLNLLKAEGVPPSQVIEDWIHRVVFIEGQSRKVPRAIGKKPTYEKHRKFETMADGIEWFRLQPDLKAHYAANPELLITDYIQQAFKRIADERFVNYIAREMEIAGKAFGVKPTEKLIAFPELFEEITGKAGRELAEKAVLRTEELTAAKQFAVVMNRALRGEKPHGATLAMLERKFPELGKRFREALGKRAELQAIKREVAELVEVRKVPFWEAKTERAFRMEQLRQPAIREGYIMQPFAGGRLYDREFINAFNKFFGHEAGLPGLNITSDAAGILRITKAALDFSFQAIQGLPSWGLAHAYLMINPKVGMRLMGAWYKSFGESIAAFFRPEVLAKAIAKERDIAMELVSKGGSARAIDYFQVLWAKKGLAGAFERAAKKIPFTPYERAETAFFGAGQLVRQRFGKILMPKALATGKEFELARFLDRITGLTDSATLGVPLTVRQLEQTFAWFAPNYTRACLTVLADIFRGGYTGAMTREALGGMVAAGAFMYSGIQYAMQTIEGKSHEESWDSVMEGFGVVTDPITKEVNWQPTGRFMTLKIGNYYMGFGGFWYGLLRLTGNIMACVEEVGEKETIDLVRIMKHGTLNKQDNPFIYWWFSRASPFFGAGFELASGKDFLGYPLETTEDYLKYIATRFEPIWMEQGLNWMIPGMARDNEVPEGLARETIVPAELFGLRTFPESNWVKFYDKANDLIKRIPEEELDQKQVDAWREGTLTWKQLTDVQRVNLLSRYPELEELYGTAHADSAVRSSQNWKQWEGRVKEERTTYYSRGDNLVERLLTGDIDSREFREMWSEAGQNYGVALGVIEKEPTYEEIYTFFDNKEAKGEKYGFMDDVALQEYINIVFEDYLDEKGDIDWDAKDKAIDEFLNKFGEETYRRIRQMYADKKRLEGLSPTLIRLADDKDKLSREYWQLPYKPINEMDAEDEKDGNIPAEYLMLWKQYQALPDVEREAFIEAHPELDKDWRMEFRRNNVEQDAMLALWGYGGKLQSREAYDMVVQWGRELDIPLEQMGLGLPLPSLIDSYFELNKIVSETSGSSIEARLYKLEHPKYLEWGLEQGIWVSDLKDESIDALRFRHKHLDTTTEYESFSDRASPNYIEDEDARRKRQAEFKRLNPRWVDDMRRVRMFEFSMEYPEAINSIESYVEYGKIADEFGGVSSEAMLYRWKNKELNTFGLKEDIFGWGELELDKVPIWEIDVKYAKQDDEYQDILAQYEGAEETKATEAYLYKNGQPTEYCLKRYKRNALRIEFPIKLIDAYVGWYTNPDLKKPDNWKRKMRTDLWYEDDWFLMENQEFYKAMLKAGIFTERRDFRKVPTREVFAQYLEYRDTPEGKLRDDYRWELWEEKEGDFEEWLLLTGKVTVHIRDKKRREELTPTEIFKEEIMEREKKFEESLEEIERKLKELGEE